MADLNQSSLQGRVVIAGGSGFLGVSLALYLVQCGFSVTLISRTRPKIGGPWEHVVWDGRTPGKWIAVLEGSRAVVNLAGRTVDCIKTPDHRDEIVRSRIESTRVLGLAMREVVIPPPVWVQMSTAHIYGDPPSAICTEDSAFGTGLAPQVGQAWEKEFKASILPAQRGVVLRTSFVVGRNRGCGAGAMSRLGLLARFGLGGKVGSGKQGLSWIHELDMNRIFKRAILNETMSGVYIASSPNPEPQSVFMRELRKSIGMPIGLPASEWMVRIGAHFLLRTDPELALYGRYVLPKRLQEEGFEFRYPELRDALAELVIK